MFPTYEKRHHGAIRHHPNTMIWCHSKSAVFLLMILIDDSDDDDGDDDDDTD